MKSIITAIVILVSIAHQDEDLNFIEEMIESDYRNIQSLMVVSYGFDADDLDRARNCSNLWEDFTPRGERSDYISLLSIGEIETVIYLRSYFKTYERVRDYDLVRQEVTYGNIVYRCDGVRIWPDARNDEQN